MNDEINEMVDSFVSLAKKKSDKKKSKKPSWQKMPGGWGRNKSIKKYWKSLTDGDEHSFTACVKKMKKKMKEPEGFCAKTKDVAEGGTDWRGGKKKKKKSKSKKSKNKS